MTPLAVWAHRLSSAQQARAAKIEASMTHPNPTVQHANACYVLAICHLINHPGDNIGAFQAARNYANVEGDDDIRDWFSFISSDAVMPGSPQSGWAKISFTHAFSHLKRESEYELAFRETMKLGGVTCSNAAIVGGMVGAAVGLEGLPEKYVEKVTSYCFREKQGRLRSEDFLDQTKILQLLDQLYEMAPATATLVIGGVEQTL